MTSADMVYTVAALIVAFHMIYRRARFVDTRQETS